MEAGEKVITGQWDGMPIWRRRTVQEVMEEIIEKNQKKRSKLPEDKEEI